LQGQFVIQSKQQKPKTMKHLFSTLAVFALTTGFLTAQERITTADFDRIRVVNGINIILIPSDRNEIFIPEGLQLQNPERFRIETSVDRSTLTISVSGMPHP